VREAHHGGIVNRKTDGKDAAGVTVDVVAEGDVNAGQGQGQVLGQQGQGQFD
jgi:hypothetical protein